MIFKSRPVGVQFIEKNTARISSIKADIKLMAADFPTQRILGLCLHHHFEVMNILFFNNKSYGNGKHLLLQFSEYQVARGNRLFRFQ